VRWCACLRVRSCSGRRDETRRLPFHIAPVARLHSNPTQTLSSFQPLDWSFLFPYASPLSHFYPLTRSHPLPGPRSNIGAAAGGSTRRGLWSVALCRFLPPKRPLRPRASPHTTPSQSFDCPPTLVTPPPCVQVLRQAGLTLKDIDVIEFHEAFAGQVKKAAHASSHHHRHARTHPHPSPRAHEAFAGPVTPRMPTPTPTPAHTLHDTLSPA
jgi:hypothetical protein